MPLSTVFGAAAISSGASSLWHYNRENYMFDVPLRQSKAYQLQNIMISRYGLFREDVRDLCALTTSRVQSYLIVNTLKLGFIVTVFYNFDRTDAENEGMNFEEKQINLLFSMMLLTSFFWLLTSIWFSMHGLVVAQSLSTKLLLRVVRIPLPSKEDINNVATESTNFERSVSEAFRVPLLQRRDASVAENKRQESMPPSRGRSRSASFGNMRTDVLSSGACRRSRSESSGDVTGMPSPPRPRMEAPPLSVTDVLYDHDDVCFEDGAGCGGMEPHLKFLMLLRANWEPFDFYSKVSMEIGTATMLSGLAYHGLYYLRATGAAFEVEAGGWCTFAFMSVLSWWSLILDLNIGPWQQASVALLVTAGPAMLLGGYNRHRMHWMLPAVFAFSTAWVLLICWLSVSRGDRWPVFWKASQFLNVLHREYRPHVSVQKDVVLSSEELKEWTPPAGAPLVRSSTSSTASSLESAAEVIQESAPHHIYVAPLVACLDRLLEWPLQAALEARIRKERDYLFEAGRAVGAYSIANLVAGRPMEGFWVCLPKKSGKEPTLEWLDPFGLGDPAEAPHVLLEDLLHGVHCSAQQLFDVASTWTLGDMQSLAMYGGEPIPGVRSFTAQFRRSGTAARTSMGQSAFRFFYGGTLIVTLVWAYALWKSFKMTMLRPELEHISIRTLGAHPLQLPLPWLAPVALGCDSRGTRLAFSDLAAGVFVAEHGPGDEGEAAMRWTGPLPACGAEDTLGADFGPDGSLWAVCASNLREVPLAGGGAEAPAGSGVGGLRAVALEAAPERTKIPLRGLAIRSGALVGLQLDRLPGNASRWMIAGTIDSPPGRTWKALGLRAGRGLVLDTKGNLFGLDLASGDWRGPERLPLGLDWLGLCALPGDQDFFAWGRRTSNTAPTRPELWRLSWPGLWATTSSSTSS